MSFKKSEIGPKGEECEYHTITLVVANYSLLPDENGNGGSMSTVRLSTFKSAAFYAANRGNADLAIKHRTYAVPISVIGASLRVPDGNKSSETKAYEQILAQDPFFSDAEVVE